MVFKKPQEGESGAHIQRSTNHHTRSREERVGSTTKALHSKTGIRANPGNLAYYWKKKKRIK